MADATGLAEAMLGLDGFRVLEVEETASEVLIRIETTLELVGCPGCGVVATAHDRMAVAYRDLAAFGRPARRQPVPRSGAPARAEPDPRPPRPQARSAQSDPKAPGHRRRAPGRDRA